MDSARLHFVVRGMVQGVFFRASTRKKALELGLFGWVKNLDGGGVECVAEGERKKLERLLSWARRGPPGAVVESIDVSWEKPALEFRGFEIK